MKKIIPILLIVLGTAFSFAQEQTEKTTVNLIQARTPKWVMPILERADFFKTYEITDSINPYYFESDFNGDNTIDVVLFIKHKASNKLGIVIINGKTNTHFILGAGKDFGMGDNMSWVKVWSIYRDKIIHTLHDGQKEMNLKYPAIQIVKNDSISAYIYWSGKKYKTYCQVL